MIAYTPETQGSRHSDQDQRTDKPNSSIPITTREGRTERANSARFVKQLGDDVRRCDPWNKWLVWDTARWAVDRQCRVEALAKQVLDRYVIYMKRAVRDGSPWLQQWRPALGLAPSLRPPSIKY